MCECGGHTCIAIIDLTPAEYQAVRASERRFAMVDGHETGDPEDVVERHARYIVVEKRPGALSPA